MISRIKGTHDMIDLTWYNHVVKQTAQHCALYNFQEIATPILESVELFKRSLGVYTDVVSKEMFTIMPHKESSELIALRPEMTASTVRAFVENSITQTPWRVFSHGPVFRYERPQKGRYRQFHQFNIEVIGAQSVSYDVQLITMLDRLFSEQLGLSNYALGINFLGCVADRARYKTTLTAFLDEHVTEICQTCAVRKEHNTLRIFDCKNPICKALYTKAPYIVDSLCDACNNDWRQVQQGLSLLSVAYSYQPTLVRGLDYYNNTAFEFVSTNLGAQNAFCAGGRYDSLMKIVSDKHDQPALGAAIGIERIVLLLQDMQAATVAKSTIPVILMPLSKEQESSMLLLADQLVAHGIAIEFLCDGSLKSMMRKANKLSAQWVMLMGSDEQAKNEVMIKHMDTGHEATIAQHSVVDYLKKHMA